MGETGAQARFSKPSKEMAEKILSELDYDERLVGYEMTPMDGHAQRSLYSFREAMDLLHGDDWANMLVIGSRQTIGYIDPGELAEWVERVFGDHELGDAIREEFQKHGIEGVGLTLSPIKALMKERYDQCVQVAGGKENQDEAQNNQPAQA